MIILTNQQNSAIKEVRRLLKLKKPVITVAGYAGTGKSTLVQYIIESLNLDIFDVAFACFTGKASLVLQQKGIPATTLHSLLFISYKNKDGKFIHIRKKELDYPYKLIVIDEISMVSRDFLQILKSFKIPIIALGDIAQLPPIGDDSGNSLLKRPDVVLTEILRQEADNPLIQLSMDVREGKPLIKTNNNNVMIIDKNDLLEGMLTWADQILCGYNSTRQEINKKIRSLNGNQNSNPEIGEKLICNKNYWNIISNKKNYPLVNGTIGFVNKIHQEKNNIQVIDLAFENFEERFEYIPISTIISDNDNIKFFDWAYAITVHKFQGSEANKILVFEEVLNRDTHKQWLYTAITRAMEKIIIIRS